MKSIKLQISSSLLIVLLLCTSSSHSNQTLIDQEAESFFEVSENEANKQFDLKSKRELSKLQTTLINVLKVLRIPIYIKVNASLSVQSYRVPLKQNCRKGPVPLVDTIQHEEKFGNKGDKFNRLGRKVVNGVETISNLVSSALSFPIEAVKKLSRSATEALNNLGGKLVGLQ